MPRRRRQHAHEQRRQTNKASFVSAPNIYQGNFTCRVSSLLFDTKYFCFVFGVRLLWYLDGHLRLIHNDLMMFPGLKQKIIGLFSFLIVNLPIL